MQHKEITFKCICKDYLSGEKETKVCLWEAKFKLNEKNSPNVFPAKGKNSIVRERILFYLFGLKVAYNTYTDIQRSCVKRFSSIDS